MREGIDIHAHYYPPAYVAALAGDGAAHKMSARHDDDGLFLDMGGNKVGPLPHRFVDLELRIAEMDRQDMAMQALSLTQPMVYFGDERFSTRLAQTFNDALVDANRQYPDRLLGLATLPMQFPERALEELDRMAAMDAIAGIYLGTNVGGEDLHSERFLPIFRRMAEHGLTLFLHPLTVIGRHERLGSFHLSNLLGNPFDTAIAAAYLIFGSVLDKVPDLKVCLTHAGGALPYLIGRLDHGYKVRGECRHLQRPPSDYLRRFWYDTISHAKPALRYLVDLVGSDRIVLGSDFCFDMGDDDPVVLVRGLDWLNEAGKARIISGNARELLGLDPA